MIHNVFIAQPFLRARHLWPVLLATILLTTMLLASLGFTTMAQANETAAEKIDFSVVITQPYLDIRTGPGKAYPVFYVAQRDERIALQKRRGKWYKIEMATTGKRTITGWVHQKNLQDTRVYLLDTPASEHAYLRNNFNPAWTVNYSLGNFERADLMSLSVAYSKLEVLSFEARASNFIGVNQQGWLASTQILYTPFPKWHLAPYVLSGYGYIKRESRGTLIEQEDQSDHYLQAGAGLRIRISSQYQLRLEYLQLNTLTSTDDNKELDTWSVGFGAKF